MKEIQQFVMLPREEYEKILKMTKVIYDRMAETRTSPKILDDYISESDAKKEFNRQTTWFWTQRQNGLAFRRLGNRVYYLKADLLKLFEEENF